MKENVQLAMPINKRNAAFGRCAGKKIMKHEWKSQRMGGNPAELSSYEWITWCDNCGVELNDDNRDEDCLPESPDALWQLARESKEV